MRLPDGHSLRVEGNKLLRPEPVPFMSDYAVGKVPTGVERSQPGLDPWPVHDDIRALQELMNRIGDIGNGFLVPSTEHPYELAKDRDGHGHQLSLLQDLRGLTGLMGFVLDRSSNEHIRVSRDFHFPLAHP